MGAESMAELVCVELKPVVHFREFPFGTITDPSMREFLGDRPQKDQDRVLEYLRSGHVLALTMGADLIDCFDRSRRANPIIHGRLEGGTTPMGDGVWFWYAGLIYFIETYNVRLPEEFVQYAAEHNWRVSQPLDRNCRYRFSYFPGNPGLTPGS
jgi:hypothetical protein